jgi:hypothetical protein
MTDKDRRTILWLAEIAAWLQTYRKAQVDYRQRNHRRPWYHRLWRAKENNPCSS